MGTEPIKRKWSYSLEDIATASGVSIHTVRHHRQDGTLTPESIIDVARYVSGWRAIKAAQNQKGMNTHETDIWGNPE